MTGVAFKIDFKGLQGALTWLHGMETVGKHELLDTLGQLGVQQTRRRIEEEKTSPDGQAWIPSKDGGSTLFRTGHHLASSIDHAAGAEEVKWGSGWIGARVHQFGATIVPVNAKSLVFNVGGKEVFAKKVVIPARPYLGLSEANAAEMEAVAVRFIGLEGGMQ